MCKYPKSTSIATYTNNQQVSYMGILTYLLSSSLSSDEAIDGEALGVLFSLACFISFLNFLNITSTMDHHSYPQDSFVSNSNKASKLKDAGSMKWEPAMNNTVMAKTKLNLAFIFNIFQARLTKCLEVLTCLNFHSQRTLQLYLLHQGCHRVWPKRSSQHWFMSWKREICINYYGWNACAWRSWHRYATYCRSSSNLICKVQERTIILPFFCCWSIIGFVNLGDINTGEECVRNTFCMYMWWIIT